MTHKYIEIWSILKYKITLKFLVNFNKITIEVKCLPWDQLGKCWGYKI